MTTFLLFGFLIGIASNFHCIGMCGPLAFALPIDRSSTLKSIISVLKYNLGRLFSYSFLGMIVGLFGFSLQLFSTLQWLSIVSGIIIVLMAWSNQVESWPLLGIWTKKMSSFIQVIFKKTKELPLAYRSFSFGIANGLLPCGMIYLGLSNALGSGSLSNAILSMSAFGIGTLPAMFFMPLLAHSRWKIQLSKRFISILLTIIGLLTIVRGMNLGIPYLSPKVNTTLTQTHQAPSMECCQDSCDIHR
ncbi:MAG: sulfite exporter TauE/SafE family protein [Flavobacteriales bacterium]